jgi:phosphoenolpyruvate-protein kinase (PTS system EI component)
LLVNISKSVKGIIARQGGLTSHSAIMCRVMGIPYVVCDFPLDFEGEVLIKNDKVYFDPSETVISEYSVPSETFTYTKEDFKDVSVYANVMNNNDIENISSAFSGIGLYRTEFLLMDKEYAFDCEKQAAAYMEALSKINGRSITFRTFDFGGDKQVEYLPILQKGVMNYYKYPVLFENQIKALLMANTAYPGQVKIMFPMIETFKQYQDLKKIVVKIAMENGYKIPKVGMMLETPTAFFNLNNFKNVDFISVGTNDLCSALFNISRERVMLFDNLYNELLNVLKEIISFSNENDIHLSVCGEVISQKEFAKKAIALGLRNVSISRRLVKNIYDAVNEE